MLLWITITALVRLEFLISIERTCVMLVDQIYICPNVKNVNCSTQLTLNNGLMNVIRVTSL